MQPFPSFAKREVLKKSQNFLPSTYLVNFSHQLLEFSLSGSPTKCPHHLHLPKVMLFKIPKKPNKWSLHLQFPKVSQNCSPGQAQQWWCCRHRPWTEKAWKVVSEWFLQYNLLLSPVKEWKDVFVLRKFLFRQPLTSLNNHLIFKSNWDLAIKAWYMLSVAGSYINEKDEFCMCRILAFEY